MKGYDAHLDLRIPHKLQHISCILNRVLPLLLIHDSIPQLPRLVVLVLLPLVPVMALAADDVIRHLVRRFSSIRPKFVYKAIRRILLVPRVVCVDAHLPVEAQRCI